MFAVTLTSSVGRLSTRGRVGQQAICPAWAADDHQHQLSRTVCWRTQRRLPRAPLAAAAASYDVGRRHITDDTPVTGRTAAIIIGRLRPFSRPTTAAGSSPTAAKLFQLTYEATVLWRAINTRTLRTHQPAVFESSDLYWPSRVPTSEARFKLSGEVIGHSIQTTDHSRRHSTTCGVFRRSTQQWPALLHRWSSPSTRLHPLSSSSCVHNWQIVQRSRTKRRIFRPPAYII